MDSTGLSKKLLIRLPIYLNYLKSLPDTVENISATKIAKALDLGDVLAGFDLYPEEFQTNKGKKIYPMSKLEQFCRKNHVRIGIITVPASKAQTVCDQLVSCGVDAIWNYAPTHLIVPEGIVVQSENLAASLTTLRMHMKRKHEHKNREDN